MLLAFFLAPAELGKIHTELVKYPSVLHEKSSNKIYVYNRGRANIASFSTRCRSSKKKKKKKKF